MELILLGTGHAVVTKCYNTCFILKDEDRMLLVDGGGGSTLLTQLKRAGISWMDLHDIVVTHKHLDHLTGILWMLRMVTQSMNAGKYEGTLSIYGHAPLMQTIEALCRMLFTEAECRFLRDRIKLISVNDGETRSIIGHDITFFDLQSTKEMQYGFSMELAFGETLTCCGDEPCPPHAERYAKGSKWLLHEAFCLFEEADRFHPYEKHHSTAKDACALAAKLGVENIVLYHTEDTDLPHRRARYTAEGRQVFDGGIWVPDDLEVLSL